MLGLGEIAVNQVPPYPELGEIDQPGALEKN